MPLPVLMGEEHMTVQPEASLLASKATQALIEEAQLTPKPALVDRRGSGAHRDLTLPLMLRSAKLLEGHFLRMAEAARGQVIDIALRERLGCIGREAESAMLQATGGLNTHKGAIWALGLLIGAASRQHYSDEFSLCADASSIAALQDRFARPHVSNGDQVFRRYGVRGARMEACSGFPHVLFRGLPALRSARQAGMTERHAQLDTLLAIMTTLDDTCLLHRGGRKALEVAQRGAAHALSLGGSSTPMGLQALDTLHRSLMELWASPGGSADMLAATLFVDSVTSSQGSGA